MVDTKPRRAPIVLLAQDKESTRIVYHALAQEFSDVRVVLERRVSRVQLMRRRAETLGIVTVIGQILFMIFIVPVLRRVAANRVEAIKQEFKLDSSPIDGPVTRVSSVNSAEARRVLQELDPGLVVVNGTRIIGHRTLSTLTAPIINMHAGITPLYRGVHGGYWALVEGRPDLVGTTIHFIDEGIDTGGVIAQATFQISREDSFVTYPYLHLAVGLPLLINAVEQILNDNLETKKKVPNLASKLRFHPTIWGYLANWTLNSVK